MPRYFGTVLTKTPNLAEDNWGLDAVANEHGNIWEVKMSGQSVVTTAMETRVARSGSGTVPVAGDVEKRHPKSDTNKIAFVKDWTVHPTLVAGSLFAESWNSHGGVIRWLASPGEEFVIIGAEQISCRGVVGLGVSTYQVVWDED